MKYATGFMLLFFSLSPLSGCAENSQKSNNKASIQDQSVLINIQRFDKDFHDYLVNPTDEQYIFLKKTYPQFLKAFGVVTTNIKDEELENPALFKSKMQSYFSNKILSKIYDDALNIFSDLTIYQKELFDANSLAKNYFGGKEFPQLAIHVSGFKANTIILDSIISISSDRYLGTDYIGYKDFFEPYQIVQMQQKYIVRDFIKAWLLTEYPQSNNRKSLLSEILYQGKILYAIQQLLPNWSEADIMGYTDNQQKWSEENANTIWKTTLNKNYLFSEDYLIIQKYIDEAPYTATISEDSPGRLGVWIGLQIIKNYAQNTNANLQSLFAENDNQRILKDAKYNP